MRLLKSTLAMSLALSFISVAQANDIFYSAPIKAVRVPAASRIYVSYKFDSARRLVCEADKASDAITSVEWTYKDATRKIDLPVVLQDINTQGGHLADSQGKLVITNEFGSSANNGDMYVTCEYRQTSSSLAEPESGLARATESNAEAPVKQEQASEAQAEAASAVTNEPASAVTNEPAPAAVSAEPSSMVSTEPATVATQE